VPFAGVLRIFLVVAPGLFLPGCIFPLDQLGDAGQAQEREQRVCLIRRQSDQRPAAVAVGGSTVDAAGTLTTSGEPPQFASRATMNTEMQRRSMKAS
jgi:hypothetical protein